MEDLDPYILLAIKIIVTIAVTFVVHALCKKTLNLLQKKGESKKWLYSFYQALKTPLNFFIFGYALLIIIDLIVSAACLECETVQVPQVKELYIVAIITWFLIRWKAVYEKNLIERSKLENTEKRALFEMISRLTSITIYVLAGFYLLKIFNISIDVFIAFFGLGGLAISWAGKDVIANFFGGLMIFVNRHITVGDLISSPNNHFEGTIEEIGWYLTRVRTLERCPTFIPNALITNAIIENRGRRYHRRIKDTISLRYQDLEKVPLVCQKIQEMIESHPNIDQKEHRLVHFNEYQSYSLDIEVYAFSKTTKLAGFRNVRQDILLRIGTIVKECGADFAFPTTEIKLDQNNKLRAPDP